jgi:quinol monooxygenase YgiN
MYGTIARCRCKPGIDIQQFTAQLKEFEAAHVPGAVAAYIFRTDADPNECYIAAIFSDKEAYLANARSPEQHARYERYRALLEAEPEWHDGEIVAAAKGVQPVG